MTGLSLNRAADRQLMAKRLADLARTHGFECEIRPRPLDARGLSVRVRMPRGLNMSVGITASLNFLLAGWHVSPGSGAVLNSAFTGDRPHHKATGPSCGPGSFDDWLAALDRSFRIVAADTCWDHDYEAWQAETSAEASAAGGYAWLPPDRQYRAWREGRVAA